MKILVGCSSSLVGGAGIASYTVELCESLAAVGHEVHLFSPGPFDRVWAVETGVAWIEHNPHGSQVPEAERLLSYMGVVGVEGVINNDNSVVQSIAPLSRCPFIAVGHLNKTAIASLACYKHTATDYVVAISEDMRTVFVEKFGVPSHKCPVVYNGVRDRGIGARRDGERPLRVLFAGGDERRKGCDVVRRTADLLSGLKHRIEIHWFGGMSQTFAENLRAHPCITLHGRVTRTEILTALECSDVLLFPSSSEGCPMAVLEALSYGVIPIVSDGIGAMRWLVQSGFDGYVCPLSHWAKGAADILTFLADSPSVVAQLRENARGKYLRQFQMSSTVQRLLSLLERPTVDRRSAVLETHVLRIHRPRKPDGRKAGLLDRLWCRLGKLRIEGRVKAPASANVFATPSK